MRPGTAYLVFLGEKNGDPALAHLPYRSRAAAIGGQWKALDAVSRAAYEQIYAGKKAIYEESHKEFLANLPPFRQAQEARSSSGRAKVKRTPRKRRASVGEVVPNAVELEDGEDERTNSTFLNESKKAVTATIKAPVKRRVRSKTIDCSSMNIRDFFQSNQIQTETPVKKVKAAVVSAPVAVAKEALQSPVKTPASPVKKAAKRKAQEEQAEEEEEVSPVVVSPKKAYKEAVPKKTKKTKTAVQDTNGEKEEAAAVVVVQPSKAPKKAVPKKKKVVLTEPVKPPQSAKAYFKSIYKGEPEQAGKAFKKLPKEEKERYHRQLEQISNQYLVELSSYMKSLSKEVSG